MLRMLILLTLLWLVAACSSGQVTHDYHPQTSRERLEDDMKSIVTKSDEPIVVYGGKASSGGGDGSGIAGSYLWKAALESISFMPLASSDSHGGTIITDWYSSPNTPNERFKFNILILSPNLQIGSIKVNAFRQVQKNGQWHSAEVSKEIPRNIEDNILRKAISLRVKSTEK